MKKHSHLMFAAVVLMSLGLYLLGEQEVVSEPVKSVSEKVNKATVPVPKTDERFTTRHQLLLERTKQGPYDLVFLGDSITQHWEEKGGEIWKAKYEKYKPANFGIGGDGIQNVLWRIENGEMDGLTPKVVVLLLGTNNSGSNTGAEIAEGDALLVKKIQQKSPTTKVLLLAIFPRGPRKDKNGVMDDGVRRMERIREANALLSKLDNGTTVRYLDIGPKFLDESGKIPNELMPDQLHPGPKGYSVWAEAMQPLLDEMMK